MENSRIKTFPADKLHPDELADIQGLIVRGYNIPCVRHFVLTIGDVQAARAFLDAITSDAGALTVTSAKPWVGGQKPPYALNIGLTAQGLEALALPPDVSFGMVKPFPGNYASFLKGAVAAAEKVSDLPPSDPNHWVTKLNTDNADRAHVLLSLYTHTPDTREAYSKQLRTMFSSVIPPLGNSDSDVFELDVDAMIYTAPNGKTYHKIHFGYTDGISNPIIDAVDAPPLRPKQLPYVAAWQFVLREGSPQYHISRPLELGQNGSFSAFRILEQDVAAFEAFLRADGRTEDEQEFLASKLCGRWRNGNPVKARPDSPGSVLSDDQLRDFDYGTDTVGEPCPSSAHTRRANPRGGPGVQGVTNQVAHRIMRRANPYGPPYRGVDDGEPRGLAGHFICASLENQFEFIMDAWVNKGTFAAEPAGIDPLLGHVPKDSDFTYWSGGKPVTKTGLSRFVTTKGGMYCYLPSITALKWVARNGGHPSPWQLPPL